jgi:hypothetical protein
MRSLGRFNWGWDSQGIGEEIRNLPLSLVPPEAYGRNRLIYAKKYHAFRLAEKL